MRNPLLFKKLRQRDRYGHYPAHIAVKHEDLVGLQMLTSASAHRNRIEQMNNLRETSNEIFDISRICYSSLNGADVFMDKDQYNNYPIHNSASENLPLILDFILSLDTRYQHG